MKELIVEVGVSRELVDQIDHDADAHGGVLPADLLDKWRRIWQEHLDQCGLALQVHFGNDVTVANHVSHVALNLTIPDGHPADDYDSETLQKAVRTACEDVFRVTMRGEEEKPLTREDIRKIFDEFGL